MVKYQDDTDFEIELSRLNQSKTFRKLREVYSSKSILEMASKQRDEGVHSYYLQWLLRDSIIPCDWKDSAISHLLDIIMYRAKEQNVQIPSEIKNAIFSRNSEISLDYVERECQTKGVYVNGKTGLIDLLIGCNIISKDKAIKLSVCIENKVDSNEHDDQTWKYWLYLKGKEGLKECKENVDEAQIYDTYDYQSRDDYQLFVFLTPHSNIDLQDILNDTQKKQNLCSCKHYVIINYQDIMNYILEPILEIDDLPRRTRFFVEQYIETLSIPCIESKNKKFPIMALSKENSILLSEFWNENKKLILAAVEAFANDENQSEEDRNTAQAISNTIKKTSVSFKIGSTGGLNMRSVAQYVVTHLINTNQACNIINQKFEKFVKQIVLSDNEYTNLINNVQATQKKSLDERKKQEATRWVDTYINNTLYHVSTAWAYNETDSCKNPNFPRFMKEVNKSNYGFRIEIE